MIESSPLTVKRACKALDTKESAYYKWKRSEPQHSSDHIVLKEILNIMEEVPRYGYRRITKELHRRMVPVNSKRVRRLMKENNLSVKKKKRFKPITTQSDHDLCIFPNLAKDIELTNLNQLWVSDITYIYLQRGFVYLAVVIDVYSRKCIGWDLGRRIDTQLALNALNMAIANREDMGFSELIHHSDRGVQYASKEYVAVLQQHGIKISMSRKGNPYDNAFAETFMKTLKVEEVYMNEYETFEQAYNDIKTFIEKVYNEKRLHSGIGYVTPDEFEKEALNMCVS